MKKLLLLVIIVLAVVIYCFSSNWGIVKPFTGDLDQSVDTIRAGYDLNGLAQTEELNKVAQAKCDDMVTRNYLSHENLEGKMVWEGTYQYTYAGENIAHGYSNAYDVARAWLNSEEHKANLLSTNFTQVGYGVCHDDKHYKIVQVFKG